MGVIKRMRGKKVLDEFELDKKENKERRGLRRWENLERLINWKCGIIFK